LTILNLNARCALSSSVELVFQLACAKLVVFGNAGKMRVAVVHASKGWSGDAGKRSKKVESRLMSMCSALGAAGVEVDIVGERESPQARDQAVADADVVVVCVTAALVELVKAGTHVDFFNAARQKPNKLVPVLLDPKLGNQADWHGGVGLMFRPPLFNSLESARPRLVNVGV